MFGRLRLLIVLGSLSAMLVLGGCAKKNVAAKPPTTPPPAVMPTASFTAIPPTIQQGQATILTWKTENATDIEIAGLGSLPPMGTRSVSPAESITYTLSAKGPGGTREASARVTVTPPPVPVAATISDDELFQQNVKDVFFDYDKYGIRPDAQAMLETDLKFLQQHPRMKVLIEGHCDERGSEEYNLALGDNRANSVKSGLAKLGISTNRLRTVSYGKEKPFCTGANEQCYQQNRRGHFVLDR